MIQSVTQVRAIHGHNTLFRIENERSIHRLLCAQEPTAVSEFSRRTFSQPSALNAPVHTTGARNAHPRDSEHCTEKSCSTMSTPSTGANQCPHRWPVCTYNASNVSSELQSDVYTQHARPPHSYTNRRAQRALTASKLTHAYARGRAWTQQLDIEQPRNSRNVAINSAAIMMSRPELLSGALGWILLLCRWHPQRRFLGHPVSSAGKASTSC